MNDQVSNKFLVSKGQTLTFGQNNPKWKGILPEMKMYHPDPKIWIGRSDSHVPIQKDGRAENQDVRADIFRSPERG